MPGPGDGEGGFVSRGGAREESRGPRISAACAVISSQGAWHWGLLEPAGVKLLVVTGPELSPQVVGHPSWNTDSAGSWTTL